VFGAASNRAYAAVFVKHARTAGGAFFGPDASFLEYAYESGIKTRVNGLIRITLCKRLYARTTAERQNSVVSLNGFGCLLEENIVALALYG
jgi:hypothetical protein